MSYHSQIESYQRKAQQVANEEARLLKKESDLYDRILREEKYIRQSNSPSSINSKLRRIERYKSELRSVKQNQSKLAEKKNSIAKQLHRYNKLQNRETMRQQASENRRKKEQAKIEPYLKANSSIETPFKYDYFICHANEDKEDFVEQFATSLTERNIKIWYDEFVLKIGDSLHRSIDRGLQNSRYGIVIISQHFFIKEWPQRELDGLLDLEIENKSRVLPIWHKISKEEVTSYSPILASKVALKTSDHTIDKLADILVDYLENNQATNSG